MLKEDSIGLFSLGDGDNTTNVYRLKLNCSEVPTYSLFEGEVVVVEGFNDSNSRFNVNRIFKPEVIPPKQDWDQQLLEKYRNMQQGKAIQTMVASGPFTSRQNLLYDTLQDLMTLVRRDQPHVLVLMGPFVDYQNEDIQEGVISYQNSTGELEFIDYE